MQQISSHDPVTISLGTTGNMAFSRVKTEQNRRFGQWPKHRNDDCTAN